MSDRPDLDEAIRIAQDGGLKITGGKYAPKVEPPKDKIEKKLYKDLAYLTQLSFETKDLQRIHHLQRKIVRETLTNIKLQQEALLDRVEKEVIGEAGEGLLYSERVKALNKLRLEL